MNDDDLIAYLLPTCTCGPTLQALNAHTAQCHAALGIYKIRRQGAPKREGGTGAKWSCSCRTETGPNCRHLRALWAGRVIEAEFETAPSTARIVYDHVTSRRKPPKGYFVKLTALGEDVLRADWAVKALRSRTD